MIIYLAFGELDSWLALDPLGRLLSRGSVDVEVRPMLGSLGNIVTRSKEGESDPLADYKARRARARNRAGQRELARYCDMLGITSHQGQREIEPVMLSLGLLWINRQSGDWFEFCRAAFEQTFREMGDIESLAGVTKLISAVDVSPGGFEEFVDAERAKLIDDAGELLEQGLLSAPAFVVDGEIFHGREHLPLVGWMLQGRSGKPPV